MSNKHQGQTGTSSPVVAQFYGNYDSTATVLSVDTYNLLSLYNEVSTVQDSIVASLKKINDTLSALQLSWVGSSATEAKQLGDWWNAAMVGLFGTNTDPTWGTLNRLLIALDTTVGNYSHTEAGLGTMWAQLAASLHSSWLASVNPGNPQSDSGNPPAGYPYKPIVETY